MQYLSPIARNWTMVRQQSQPTLASGPSTAQTPVAQTSAVPQGQPVGGQTLEELLKLQQQQQATPFGQNYLRQFMSPASTNYFQQLY